MPIFKSEHGLGLTTPARVLPLGCFAGEQRSARRKRSAAD